MSKRILTLKSILGFGCYSNVTIENIISRNKQEYLRWVYFNNSNIDFMPEILDIIKIPIEFRLNKPSKNIEFHEKLKEILGEKKEVVDWKRYDRPQKKRESSRYELLMMNHGHKRKLLY
jgi:hypothetical protein